MAEVQFEKGEKTINFLISQGGENGISTTDEVKKEAQTLGLLTVPGFMCKIKLIDRPK